MYNYWAMNRALTMQQIHYNNNTSVHNDSDSQKNPKMTIRWWVIQVFMAIFTIMHGKHYRLICTILLSDANMVLLLFKQQFLKCTNQPSKWVFDQLFTKKLTRLAGVIDLLIEVSWHLILCKRLQSSVRCSQLRPISPTPTNYLQGYSSILRKTCTYIEILDFQAKAEKSHASDCTMNLSCIATTTKKM